jgi:lipopolysaccharide biosynthesis glycosyltransferase
MCVFHQQSYINLLKLLITSISENATLNATDILIITSPIFEVAIKKELRTFDLPLKYYLLDLHTLFDACAARLQIFNYHEIDRYDKILYLDTDILVNRDITILFHLDLTEKLYALEEGTIGHEYWGSQFFDFSKYNKDLPAFTSGILYFKNTHTIQVLFDTIHIHMRDYIESKQKEHPSETNFFHFVFGDQPFIVYHAISQDKYDNQLLKLYVENNPDTVGQKIIYHFPGGVGSYESKHFKMTYFWEQMVLSSKINQSKNICTWLLYYYKSVHVYSVYRAIKCAKWLKKSCYFL